MHNDALWRAAKRRPYLVAALWSGTPAELAAFLGCDEATAIRLGLCRAARPGEDLAAWAGRIAGQFGLDLERMRLLAGALAR